MNKALCAAAIALTTSAALAQAPDARRMAEIWGAARARMERQYDAWFDEGDYPRSIGGLTLMNVLWPWDYETATNLGFLLKSVEMQDLELAVYVRFRTDNPDDPDASWPEANYYFQQRLYAKVPPLLEPSINMARRPHPNTYRLLAHAYERIGMLRDAKRVWEALLAIVPGDAAAQNNLKRVNEKLQGGSTTSADPPPRR